MFNIDAYLAQMDEELFDAVLEAAECESYETIASRFQVPVEVVSEIASFWEQD